MSLHRLHRRPIALLEVLICFALVVLCFLPLIYPNVFILKKERESIALIDLDHAAALLYAQVLQKLYRNEIPWAAIETSLVIPVDAKLLEESGYSGELPYGGTFQFVEVRKKLPPEDKPGEKSAWLYRLVFTFSPKVEKTSALKEYQEPPIHYEYEVAIEKRS